MDRVDRFTRCRYLFGEDFEKLVNAKILLLGVGGIGSFCLDGLYRSGLQNITIVDFDTYDVTNQNRQIGSEAVGEIKVKRLKALYTNITSYNEKVTKEWLNNHDISQYDLVIDAIDDIKAKVELALHVNGQTTLISSMGGAKKYDPTQIQISSIWKTKGDPLAKKFRYELKKAGFKGSFEVVFSDESSKCTELGSFVGVTGSFGLALCSLAIQTLLKS